MRRHSSLLSWIVAIGLLLHAATAAASVWCSMAGSLSTACACARDEAPDHGWLLHSPPGDCCRPALDAPEVEPGAYAPTLAPVLAILPWERLLLRPVEHDGWLEEAVPTATSPPLLALASVVIVR